MKIGKWLLLSCLLVAGLAFVGFTPQSYAAVQKKNLVDDSGLDCSGSVVGNVKVKAVGSGVLVKVKITKGSPNTSRTVYWVCQSGTGCHSGCGYVSIGTITTDGKGKGKFKYKGPIPMAGDIHFDILSSGNYFSGIFAAPSTDTIEVSEGVVEGDPTQQ
ncbi:MAG: hypothetical protein HZB37_02795 [Planctomycetes bacterium]|nr:hypothetical protein [Planctomycetota bacterium]